MPDLQFNEDASKSYKFLNYIAYYVGVMSALVLEICKLILFITWELFRFSINLFGYLLIIVPIIAMLSIIAPTAMKSITGFRVADMYLDKKIDKSKKPL